MKERGIPLPQIVSVSCINPPNKVFQNQVKPLVKHLFQHSFKDIERLLTVFQSGQIESRYFVKELNWFEKDHSFREKNHEFIEWATKLSVEAIIKCLSNKEFLISTVKYDEIDAIFFISTTGLSTPSIDARIMNELPFSPHTKRIPIWGLGCAGGVSGLARAFDYCLAYPKAKVIVLTVELCSLTFQKNDQSKSNLIGASLFADGAACTLICGDQALVPKRKDINYPTIVDSFSTLLPHSLDVMGWEVKEEGLFVIFSKDIPSLVKRHFKDQVVKFLKKHHLSIDQVDCWIAHPGGKKVLDAFVEALEIEEQAIQPSREILKNYGNMSSATVIYVLQNFMRTKREQGTIGLACALGPGFSSELLLVRWDP